MPTDYIEYMMGHVIGTYNTVKTKGVESLRNIYATSGLSIRPKTKATKLDILKEIIRSFGYDPEKIMIKETLSAPHRTVIAPNMTAEQLLRNVLKELVKREFA